MTNQHAKAGYFKSGLPYVRIGQGPKPLVIFQGLLFENKPQAGMTFGYSFLGKEYTIFAVLRKAGMPPGYTLKAMADDYATMIQEEFGSSLDVLGVSTGGSIVQHFAADHPELVNRLVIHSSAHTLSDEARRLQLEVARLAQHGQASQAGRALMRYTLPSSGIWKILSGPMVWVAGRLMVSGAAPNLSDLVITVEAEDRHNFKERLAEIRAPTLVIAGAEDPFYTPNLFRETAAGIPQARLVLYDKMRHPATGKRFQRDVLAFLSEERMRS